MSKIINHRQKSVSLKKLLLGTNHNLPLRVFNRRDMIPQRDDVLWKIERGIVKSATWNEDGTFITLGYWGVGDIVGFPLSKVTPYQLECLTATELTLVPLQLWHQDINILLSHIQQTEELLSIVNCKGVYTRTCLFLGWLSKKFGQDIAEGKLIDINLTHQEIGEVLNTTRVTVTRLLMQLEAESKIIRHRRQIIVTYNLLPQS